MSHSTTVFVLSNNHQSILVETLFDFGFIPIQRGRMMRALEKIRHENFAAIFVDRNSADTDVLEFILNVRDINEQIPVIVVGEANNLHEAQAISKQQNTFLLHESSRELESFIRNFFDKKN